MKLSCTQSTIALFIILNLTLSSVRTTIDLEKLQAIARSAQTHSNDVETERESKHTIPDHYSIFDRITNWMNRFMTPIIPHFSFLKPITADASTRGLKTSDKDGFMFKNNTTADSVSKSVMIVETDLDDLCDDDENHINPQKPNEVTIKEKLEDFSLGSVPEIFNCNGKQVNLKNFCAFLQPENVSSDSQNGISDKLTLIHSENNNSLTVWQTEFTMKVRCIETDFFKDTVETVDNKTSKKILRHSSRNATGIPVNSPSQERRKTRNTKLEMPQGPFKQKKVHNSSISLRLDDNATVGIAKKLSSDREKSIHLGETMKNQSNLEKAKKSYLGQRSDESKSSEIRFDEKEGERIRVINMGRPTGTIIACSGFVGAILGMLTTITTILIIRKYKLRKSKCTNGKLCRIRKDRYSTYTHDNDKSWEKFTAMLSDTTDDDD